MPPPNIPATQFEYEEEDAVYDKVDEQEYAKLVTERREAGVGFVVDDDGFGYADIGEEDDWGGAEARGGSPRRCAGQGAQMAGPNILVEKIAAKPPVRATMHGWDRDEGCVGVEHSRV